MRLNTTQLTTLLGLAVLCIAASRPDAPVRLEQPAPAPVAVAVVETPPAPAPAAKPFHPEPVTLGRASDYTPPDFSRFTDVAEKKRAFYNYLLPMVHEANEEVVRERAWLEALAHSMVAGRVPTAAELEELTRIEDRYAVRDHDRFPVERVATLLSRVDVVPASLVIAQAAKESGWGTSRFARKGNNFFGIWCFYEGCGMTPLRRSPGRTHEVAMFDTVEEGVRYYIRTINTHVAYDDLRRMRADARRNDEIASGTALANGLIRYSERGLAYVREVQSMIRYNEMQRFTRPYSA